MKKLKMMLMLTVVLIGIGCEKPFLDEKPDKSLLVPETLSDLRAILNNDYVKDAPALGLMGSDDFELSTALLLSQPPTVRNTYLWMSEVFEGEVSSDWNTSYKQIFYVNVVLDGLKKIEGKEKDTAMFNQLKGEALFRRALTFHNLSQLFAKSYNESSAETDFGLQLRLSSDVNLVAKRSSVKKTYDQILTDLENSIPLLPNLASYKNTPSKPAAFALMARVYLGMGNFEMALNYAKKCLALNGKLIDFNTINVTLTRTMPNALPNGNDEVLYYEQLIQYGLFTSAMASINPQLYQLYMVNDIRRDAFFRDRGNGIITFKGSYAGSNPSTAFFSGLAIDEIYLISAECNFRLNNIQAGLSDLNFLLQNRYKKLAFVPVVDRGKVELLKLVFQERRKELVCRGLRWYDLKRLNKENEYAVTLRRIYNGQEYVLQPNDNRYVLPIPVEEVLGSGVEQNLR